MCARRVANTATEEEDLRPDRRLRPAPAHEFFPMTPHRSRALSPAVVALFALFALAPSACVTTQPWERETLAKPAMSPDTDGDQEALRAHVFSLREGAQGGFGGGGGGCGCN